MRRAFAGDRVPRCVGHRVAGAAALDAAASAWMSRPAPSSVRIIERAAVITSPFGPT